MTIECSFIYEELRSLKSLITRNLNDLSDKIKTKIKVCSTDIINKLKSEVISSKHEIIETSQSFIKDLQLSLIRAFITLLSDIGEALTAQTAARIRSGELFYELTKKPIVIGIASGVGEIVTT